MYRPSFEATRVHVSPRDYQSVVVLAHSLNDLCAGVRKNFCTSVIHSLILSKNQVSLFPLVYTSGRMGKDSRSTVLLNLYCSVSFLEFFGMTCLQVSKDLVDAVIPALPQPLSVRGICFFSIIIYLFRYPCERVGDVKMEDPSTSRCSAQDDTLSSAFYPNPRLRKDDTGGGV